MSKDKKPKDINVRFKFPEDVHQKIKTHQRKLSAANDDDVTLEQATIAYIRAANL